MPLPLQDIIDLSDPEGSIRISLEEARCAIQSLLLLVKEANHPGVADWISETSRAMSTAEMETNELVMCGLHYVALPLESWHSFPAYVNHLAAMDPVALRDKMLAIYEHKPYWCGMEDKPELEATSETVEVKRIDLTTALSSPDQYLAYLRQRFLSKNVDEKIERAAYALVVNPPEMQRVVVDHLRMMWQKYLAAEWQRVRPVLQQAVRALRQTNWEGLSFAEAARLATGQELNDEKLEREFSNTRRLVLVPHPHTGPYTMKLSVGDGTLFLFIGARLPEGSTLYAPDLTRSEIVVRLNALADDIRLQILRQIVENGELRSQEIIDMLDLSQSAASRHLTQLTAAGYLKERRCEGAKCYSLNPERVNLMLRAVANYLMVDERSLT
jgi:DNA-binding transcriptional ArsR family regulator